MILHFIFDLIRTLPTSESLGIFKTQSAWIPNAYALAKPAEWPCSTPVRYHLACFPLVNAFIVKGSLSTPNSSTDAPTARSEGQFPRTPRADVYSRQVFSEKDRRGEKQKTQVHDSPLRETQSGHNVGYSVGNHGVDGKCRF